jgi:hypothetical protein
MMKNNDSLALDNVDKEKEELLDYVEENHGVVNNTPAEMATNANDSVDELWKTASELAAALTRYVTKEGLEDPMTGGRRSESTLKVARSSQGHCNDCSVQGACQSHKAESPASPDPEGDGDREWRSDTSEAGSRDQPYRPEVSSISSEVVVEEKMQAGIKSVVENYKGYWEARAQPKRIALVRPRSRSNREWLARRRTYMPLEFRMSSHAPVVQTREVISRVTMADGTVVEETLQNRFVLARTVSTQTRPEMMEPVGMPILSFESIVVPEVNVIIDLTQDSDEGGERESSGTPLQDERK